MHDDVAREEDRRGRERALDVRSSFLVQAPAGSGKTELLIQRYLALLSGVDRPERILAITFTRKAATEMRERVIAALRDAAQPAQEADPHRERTRALAAAALARDKALHWRILEHPARLSISTIDALAAMLTRRTPLLAGIAAMPKVEERAQSLYVAAARATLGAASADDPAWRTLLAHLANDAARAVELVAAMLARREQWLPLVGRGDPAQLRRELECVLAAEIAAELSALRAVLTTMGSELPALAAYAADNLFGDARWTAALRAFAMGAQWPPETADALDLWRALARWLLVASEARVRARVDIKCGFPPAGTGEGAVHRAERKTTMQAVLAELAARPGFAEALDVARRLPPPHYEDRDWKIVACLLEILPQAVAQLTLVFGAENRVDFTHATLAALAALGSSDAPSDLLLRLDLAIDHLLVDEFQDTSAVQDELLTRLTSGWEPGDGRTVFAVGDPMQSIYRFRAAEVRLFLAAQEEGRVCGVPAQFIELSRNFRSQGEIVAWVNGVFPQVLAAASDPWRGVVAFVPSAATRDSLPEAIPTVDVAASTEAEAALVVAHVQKALAAGAGDVGILVRARAHLAAILPALRAAGIAYAAVELDSLGMREVTLDLRSLTHALIQPDDRLAWLCVLRAPWCGLALPDLVSLSDSLDDGLAGLCRLADLPAALSENGRVRLRRVVDILQPVFDARGVAPLADRVRSAWLALGGPELVVEPIDRDAARQFFELLAASEQAGDLRDWDAFCEALDALHARPESDPDVRVQVMTLHRAKGLQFDTVIMPGLANVPRASPAELLRWRARPHGLMLAPIDARGGEGSALYAYLASLAAQEGAAELGRVLYVGATRARTRLHLTAVLDAVASDAGTFVWKDPRSGSALERLWPAVSPVVAPPSGPPSIAVSSFPRPPLLRRVPLDWRPAVPQPWWTPPPVDAGAAIPLPAFDWAHATAAAIGTVAHRLLADVARDGIARWSAQRVAAQRPRVALELAAEGVPPAERDAAADKVLQAVDRTLADERGRWLFAPAHAEARSEWALAGVDAGKLIHVTLDRTFVAEGARWIVDFKTGQHEGGDVAAFLDREQQRYRAQLERYARIVGALEALPVELALYYPLVPGGWRHWSYDAPGSPAELR